MANYTSIHCGPDGRSSLCSPACTWLRRSGEAPRSPRSPQTISVSSWPRLAWPGAGGAFVRQTGFGTLRWSSLLQNAPQLMDWDTTVTTWPCKAPLNSPAVLPCVTYSSKSRPTTAMSFPYLRPLICAAIAQNILFYCTSAPTDNSQSTIRSSDVALQNLIAMESQTRLICFFLRLIRFLNSKCLSGTWVFGSNNPSDHMIH